MVAIESIIARELGVGVDTLSEDMGYQSIPEWDSLRHVELMVALETEFGTEITDDLMLQLQSVGAIRDFFQMRTNGTAAQPATSLRTVPTADLSNISVHRGLEGVYVDRTTITRIDGEQGVLEYRGYNIHDLVEHSSFEETAWLLLYGDLPDASALASFKDELRSSREVPDTVVDILRALAGAHPMEALRTGVSVLGALSYERGDQSAEAALRAGIRLIAQVPTLIATHHALRSGREPVPPHASASHAWNVLHMLFGEEPSTDAVRFVDKDLIVHADHDANASTFASRVTIGCRANLHAAITAAIGAFAGSVHGGAAECVTELIDAVGAPENAAAYVRARRSINQPVMGFGHRVYRTEDPRVRHLRSIARDLGRERGDTRGFEIIEALVQAMEPYARHGVGPNVDLYAGLAYRLLGLPDDLSVPMFVAGRMAGWAAQALEQHNNNVLIRPRMQYVGSTSRSYRPSERGADR
jgi:citrate synthase